MRFFMVAEILGSAAVVWLVFRVIWSQIRTVPAIRVWFGLGEIKANTELAEKILDVVDDDKSESIVKNFLEEEKK